MEKLYTSHDKNRLLNQQISAYLTKKSLETAKMIIPGPFESIDDKTAAGFWMTVTVSAAITSHCAAGLQIKSTNLININMYEHTYLEYSEH
jgi:hypothetical protein